MNALIGIGKTASEIVILAIAIDRLNAVRQPINYSKNERSHYLLIQTVVIAVLMSFGLTAAKQVGVDESLLITVCTAGAATGPYAFLVSTIYTGTFLILLYCKFLTFPRAHVVTREL